MSEMSQSVIVGEEDIQDLIKELDIEAIRKEVFILYDIKYGLDTQLALRKVQVIEAEDQMFQNYLECLKEAHDRFLSYIFQGHKFHKMEQNPLHSQDLNHGVPPFFNEILDELLDDTHAIYAEEYQMEQVPQVTQSPRTMETP